MDQCAFGLIHHNLILQKKQRGSSLLPFLFVLICLCCFLEIICHVRLYFHGRSSQSLFFSELAKTFKKKQHHFAFLKLSSSPDIQQVAVAVASLAIIPSRPVLLQVSEMIGLSRLEFSVGL